MSWTRIYSLSTSENWPQDLLRGNNIMTLSKLRGFLKTRHLGQLDYPDPTKGKHVINSDFSIPTPIGCIYSWLGFPASLESWYKKPIEQLVNFFGKLEIGRKSISLTTVRTNKILSVKLSQSASGNMWFDSYLWNSTKFAFKFSLSYCSE